MGEKCPSELRGSKNSNLFEKYLFRTRTEVPDHRHSLKENDEIGASCEKLR